MSSNDTISLWSEIITVCITVITQRLCLHRLPSTIKQVAVTGSSVCPHEQPIAEHVCTRTDLGWQPFAIHFYGQHGHHTSCMPCRTHKTMCNTYITILFHNICGDASSYLYSPSRLSSISRLIIGSGYPRETGVARCTTRVVKDSWAL